MRARVAPSIWQQDFIQGRLDTPLGPVPLVGHRLTGADRLGGIKVRWGLGRMHYTVVPGLYALGSPDDRAPVLVTANYKLSFDSLRRSLGGLSLWILAVDTNGINVWCAAGKGSFGTEGVVKAIADSGLEGLVSHRRLILPQLSAPGVSGHRVRRQSGFAVRFGPIRAQDLPAFLAAGGKATPTMRRKTFTLYERAQVAPIELVLGMRYALPAAAVLLLLGGAFAGSGFWGGILGSGLYAASALMAGFLAATLLGPLLLPWLPGRAFSLKGLWLGCLLALPLLTWGQVSGRAAGALGGVAWLLLVPALVSFVLMNFTGASTYTSLSGVRKEMRRAIPWQAAAAALGLALWLSALALP